MLAKTTGATLAGLAASLLLAGAAHAQVAKGSCGVTASGATSTSIRYDPFSASGLQQVDVPLTLTRYVSGGAKTQQVFFVMTRPDGSPPYQMTVTAPGGTALGKVLYTETEASASGRPVMQASASDQIYYNFGGAQQPDTVTYQLKITVPAGTDLRAGEPITFGIRYVCDGIGGLSDVTTAAVNPAAVSINVRVMSALRATYAGTTMDFGEIGGISADTSTVPVGASKVTSDLNRFLVLSSGAYAVTLKSENGFTLRNGGATPGDSIRYSLRFLGRDLSDASPTPTVQALLVNCRPAGVIAPGELLPIQARLLEGGQGKNPSSAYRDVLTVTFAPLADANGGTETCSAGRL